MDGLNVGSKTDYGY